MSKMDTDTEGKIVELYRQGRTQMDIANALGLKQWRVGTVIRERVTQAERSKINGRTRRKRNEEFHRANPSTALDEPVVMTWAGAFRSLAEWCRDNGQEEAWAHAQEIAAERGMTL